MLNFDGETGPYVQYAHARACSILKNAPTFTTEQIDYSKLDDETSMQVCKLLETFQKN